MSYLERQRELGVISEQVYRQLQQEVKREADQLLEQRHLAKDMEQRVRQEEMHALRRKLLLVRKESMRQASVDGAIDEVVMRRLVGELDERLHQLDVAHHEEVSAAPKTDRALDDGGGDDEN
jgi:hypothetical protein